MDARSNVSVVDDDPSVRESLPDLLTALGYSALTFVSAEAFLAAAKVDDTDCLILDVSLPGMSGPDLQRELSRRGSTVPIIFITANVDVSLRQRVLDQGAVECLFKPYSTEALVHALHRAMSRA